MWHSESLKRQNLLIKKNQFLMHNIFYFSQIQWIIDIEINMQ